MRILIIHGSPRKGNTWNILNMVKKRIDNMLDVDYHIIELSKINLKMCIGCFNCILKGEEKCPHYKEMLDITEKINACDGIIITSPIYSIQLSGVLKNFIDHMSYNFHRPRYFTKKSLIITTTAGVAEKRTADYIEEVLNFWGINSVYKIPLKYRDILSRKNIDIIDKETNKFVKDLKSGIYKEPSFKTLTYYNGFRAMAMNLYTEDSADYKYWKETGMCDYSYNPNINVSKMKLIYGESIYKVISYSLNKDK